MFCVKFKINLLKKEGMFSKACEYAIRATIFVASESQKGNKVGIKDIAIKINSPEPFTAKILQKLVKKQIITSFKGVGGGFAVEAHKMSEIKLTHILQAIECDDMLKGCVLGLEHCSELHPCPFHHKYKPIKENFIKIIENTDLNELISGFQLGTTFLKV